MAAASIWGQQTANHLLFSDLCFKVKSKWGMYGIASIKHAHLNSGSQCENPIANMFRIAPRIAISWLSKFLENESQKIGSEQRVRFENVEHELREERDGQKDV